MSPENFPHGNVKSLLSLTRAVNDPSLPPHVMGLHSTFSDTTLSDLERPQTRSLPASGASLELKYWYFLFTNVDGSTAVFLPYKSIERFFRVFMGVKFVAMREDLPVPMQSPMLVVKRHVGGGRKRGAWQLPASTSSSSSTSRVNVIMYHSH